MIGHLGPRASALLDGHLEGEEAERAWAHVHACRTCRDVVAREGWVKHRLAGLAEDRAAAPEALKGALLGTATGPAPAAGPLGPVELGGPRRRHRGLATLGGGAAGAAVLGVLALGAAPASAPTMERRGPVLSTQLNPGSGAAFAPASVGAGRRGR